MTLRYLLSICGSFALLTTGMAQERVVADSLQKAPISLYEFNSTDLIPSAILIGIGAVSYKNRIAQEINLSIKTFVQERSKHVKVDDYLQFAPLVAVYGMNALGYKGKHNFKNRTIILGTATLLMASTVSALKYSTKELRPDGSAWNSFPSGHTATAFMNAEFLFQEYKDQSPIYGIVGYATALSVGYLRVHNNKHWASDVITGAGIGILSTKVAYWSYPWVKRTIFGESTNSINGLVMPYYNGTDAGVVARLVF